MQRVTSAGEAGTGCPEARHASAIRSGIRPGARNAASPASTTDRSAGTRAAASSSPPRSGSPQARTHSWSSHSPMMLRRYRTVPSSPSSLVKLAARLSSVSTGAVSSRPASDQVPVQMYAKRSPEAGTAATAEAVSCDPTAVTRTGPASPVSSSTRGVNIPAGSPGRRSGAKRARSIPSRSATSYDQSRVRGSISWVVEALVSSVPCSPVSQYVSRSGISSSRRAWANWAVPLAATSWYSVLKGAYCNPVAAYSSSGGSVAHTFRATPSVRASR